MYEKIPVVPTGTTGNVTSTGVRIDPYDALGFEFIVEVAGATPTITWKIQATTANPDVLDAAANWYDLAYITDASDTVAVSTRVATGVGGQLNFLSNPVARKYRRFRVVPTSNTNITYRVDAYRVR